MLSFTLLFTLLVLDLAAAQNSTSNFDATKVDPTLRSQWCGSQQNSCAQLCGGKQYTQTDKCDPGTLTWTCTCQNGQTPPNIDQYIQTIPNFECQFTFQQCNTQTPGSTQCSAQCGTLNPKDVKGGAGAASTSKAAASSTVATAGASSASSPAPSATKGAAARYAPEAGLAAVVVGAVGMIL